MNEKQDKIPEPASPADAERFVILGLPRSGSTYLMTLLNSHSRIYCSGEQFNPYAIVGISGRNEKPAALKFRERAPMVFMRKFFDTHGSDGSYDRVGFKFMIGHNIRVLKNLAREPGLRLIYVHRDNRLAQVSSLIKAATTNRWAQSRHDEHVETKIKVNPQRIVHRWHEYETFDFLFSQWFRRLPQERITLEYRDMFKPGFENRICDFLDMPYDPEMKSPLVKQGSNTILDRFENPKPIERYFRDIGYGHWLEDELESPAVPAGTDK
jgi:LPS sulfotransferase NodH